MSVQQLSAENNRLFGNAKSMCSEWESFRDKHLKDQWDRYNKFEQGDHWFDTPTEDGQANVVLNHIRKIKYWYISLLTDQPAKISVYGRSQDDYQPQQEGGLSRTERVDKMLQQLWSTLYMENRRMTAWDYALTYSVGWFKPHINLNKMFYDGKNYIPGDIDCAVLDPWFVGVDPSACWSANPIEILDTAEYMIHYAPQSMRRLARTYPDMKDQIENLAAATKEDFSPWHFRSTDGQGKVRDEFISQANAAGTTTNTGGDWYKLPTAGKEIYDGKQIMIKEVYMRDADYGKVCLTIAGDMLLNVRGGGQAVHSDRVCDGGEYPYQHGEFPFIPYVVHPRPGKLFGYGIFDILISPQEILNKSVGQIIDIRNMYKSPVVAIEEGSCDARKLVYAPGAKFVYKPGSQPPQILNTAAIPNDLPQMVDLMQGMLQELGGINESLMSGNIKAGTPGVAVEGMIEQAMQRIRLLERYNIASNKMLGRQMMSIMQQRYQYTGIEARILAPEGDPQSIFLSPDDWLGELDLEIIPASALTMKKAEWFKKLMDIDATGRRAPLGKLVEYGGFPDTESLVNEIEQEMAIQEQMDAMQQRIEELEAMTGGGAPPPQAGGQM